jgi:hypothetical protein
MSQVLTQSEFKYAEENPDGSWLIRYGVVPVGHTFGGEKIVTFGSSLFPERPTLQQVLKSLLRYVEAFPDDEAVAKSIMNTRLKEYFY